MQKRFEQKQKCHTSFGGDSIHANANEVSLDADGNIYIYGDFIGPADFDPGPDSTIINSSGNDVV